MIRSLALALAALPGLALQPAAQDVPPTQSTPAPGPAGPGAAQGGQRQVMGRLGIQGKQQRAGKCVQEFVGHSVSIVDSRHFTVYG